MTDLGKTPWIDRTATALWSRIVAASPRPEWVPQQVTSRGSKVSVAELGCGHYGCVMPTEDPKVVCKVTSDVTEATFIVAAATLRGEPPEGIVRYHGIYQLPEKHRGRDTFILWREAALDVGLPSFYSRDYRAKNLATNLYDFKTLANLARETLKGSSRRDALLEEARKYEGRAWDICSDFAPRSEFGPEGEKLSKRFKGALRLAVALRLCDIMAEIMENTDGSDMVGSALRYYLQEGILLADVHTGNVGTVERTSGWVITDPGHAVGLEGRWDNLRVRALP